MLDGEDGVVEGQSAGEGEIDRSSRNKLRRRNRLQHIHIVTKKLGIYTRSLGPRFFAGIGTVVVPFSFSVET